MIIDVIGMMLPCAFLIFIYVMGPKTKNIYAFCAFVLIPALIIKDSFAGMDLIHRLMNGLFLIYTYGTMMPPNKNVDRWLKFFATLVFFCCMWHTFKEFGSSI